MPRSTAGTPKRPAHEVLLTELERVLHGRGGWREQEGALLVKVIGQCVIPPQAIASVISRLEVIQSKTTRRIGLEPVLASLRADYMEHVR